MVVRNPQGAKSALHLAEELHITLEGKETFIYEPALSTQSSKSSAQSNRAVSNQVKFFANRQVLGTFDNQLAKFPCGTHSFPFSIDFEPGQKKPPSFNLTEERALESSTTTG